jgi:hypothetical protein
VRAAVFFLALLLIGCGGAPERAAAPPSASASPSPSPSPESEPEPEAEALPEPDGALPRDPEALAAELTDVAARLRAAIRRWREEGDPGRGGAPEDVELLALRQQRITLRLAERRRLSAKVLPLLAGGLRSRVRDDVGARRDLAAIHSVVIQRPRIRIARPQPADRLRAHYRRAWRRFGVGPPLLAAVNLVESQFGRLRNESTAGAQGPMQFIPATWAAYGLGGDVRDPRDAILGAANYLHANGAPGDEARALYHYNPSTHYVSAVRRYARQMRRDPDAFYSYYAWQVFVGGKRRSGPGVG